MNNRINAALLALGSAMSLGTSSLDEGFFTTTNISATPLTSGVSSFQLGRTNVVHGGTSLIRTRTESGNQTFIAFETTVVPEPGSMLALLSLVSFGAGAVVLRRRRATQSAK